MKGKRGGGWAHSLVARISHVTVAHARLSRGSTGVTTRYNRGAAGSKKFLSSLHEEVNMSLET